MTRYERTIAGNGSHEIEVKKSRFICSLARVPSEAAARDHIEVVRKRFWDANHNCTAWRIGPDGRQQRSSDDGEPAGTAGIPMLDVLRYRELSDVVAIVTRYFGGVKLGTGGLIRAYGGAVSATIDALGVVERRPLHTISLEVPHRDSGRIEHALRGSAFPLAEVAYNAAGVRFVLRLAPDDLEAFDAWVAGITSGEGRPQDEGVTYVDVPA